MVDFPASYVSLLSNVQWGTSPQKKNVTTTGNLDFLQPPPLFPPGFSRLPEAQGTWPQESQEVILSNSPRFKTNGEHPVLVGGWTQPI